MAATPTTRATCGERHDAEDEGGWLSDLRAGRRRADISVALAGRQSAPDGRAVLPGVRPQPQRLWEQWPRHRGWWWHHHDLAWHVVRGDGLLEKRRRGVSGLELYRAEQRHLVDAATVGPDQLGRAGPGWGA